MSTFASLLPLLFGAPGTPGIDADALDPSAIGRAGAIGSWFIQTDTGDWWRKFGALDTDWSMIGTGSGGSVSWFGNGYDGDVTLGAGTTTLTRDMYYNNLTVPNGATLDTDGYRIFVLDTLTIEVGGQIDYDGGNAVGSVGGTFGISIRSCGLGVGGVGGGNAGSAGANGSANNDQPHELGAPICQGGAGGAGVGGVTAGGAGGAVNLATAADGGCMTAVWMAECVFPQSGDTIPGGSSGGAGGGGTSGTGRRGGGSGAGGGVVVISAMTIVNDGVIAARGGNGGDADPLGNGGGGGGGGGGKVFILTQDYTGNVPDVSGGAGGAGAGTGVGGSAGNDGYYYIFEGL